MRVLSEENQALPDAEDEHEKIWRFLSCQWGELNPEDYEGYQIILSRIEDYKITSNGIRDAGFIRFHFFYKNPFGKMALHIIAFAFPEMPDAR